MKKMSKQKRSVLICVGVFALLLIAYFAVVQPLVNSGIEEDTTAALETLPGEVDGGNGRYLMFPQVERKNMQSMLVENENGSYEFYRDSAGEFQIRGFEGTSFDLTKFSSLVTSCGYPLAKVKVMDNADAAALQEYGLDKPQANWTLTTLTGEKYKVLVGYDLLTGGGYYCMLEGRPSVYVLDTTIAETIFAPIEYLCSPLLMAGVEQNDYFNVDDFTVMHGEEVLFSASIVPKEEQNNPEAMVEHRMTYPAPYAPDTDVLYEIFQSFMALSGQEVVKLGPTDADFEKYGLMKPAHTLYFTYKDAQIMLMFSEKQEDGIYYATSTLFPHLISAVPAETVPYLDYKLIHWIDDYPFQQWITAVSSMSISGYGTDVRFDLTHGTNADGNATLDVTTDRGVFIPDAEIYNFRQLYKTLLSLAVIDYTDLSETEVKAMTGNAKNCTLTFSFKSLSGKETVFRFYPYSGTGRRALMSLDGSTEFYVQTDLVEKIASDAQKVLTGLDVNSYGKN